MPAGNIARCREVAAIIADEAFDYLDAPVKRLKSRLSRAFSPDLETFVLPSVEGIVKAVREMF
ncbi:MAG: hypothetical protein ACLVJO_14570 [[Clostridium] scindens]